MSFRSLSYLAIPAVCLSLLACQNGSSDDVDASDESDAGSESGENSNTANSEANSNETEEPSDSDDPSDSQATTDESESEVDSDSEDPNPLFSFFATSMDGLLALAPDPVNGFGGDLGGLEGADEICMTLAQQSNPGDTKLWQAFLSIHEGPGGGPVNAIDRIGEGPWYDFNGRLLAQSIEELLPGGDGRPQGGDPQLAEMFSDEYGAPISPDTSIIDNHDMLTGSDQSGQVDTETCQDWTSADREANGRPRIGHAWPRNGNMGRNWLSDHPAGGCGAGVNIEPGGGADGVPTVGAGGGYGGFYCFAVAP